MNRNGAGCGYTRNPGKVEREEAMKKIMAALKRESFGVRTDIDIRQTLGIYFTRIEGAGTNAVRKVVLSRQIPFHMVSRTA